MTDMKHQLEHIRKAYDLTVKQHEEGIDPLNSLPGRVVESPGFDAIVNDRNLSSGSPDLKEYLAPEEGMRFLDAGCSANLANYRLDRWPSTYYGIDLSPSLIDSMKRFAAANGISFGGLHVADLSQIPFEDDFFDIGAAIGVLEYCTLEYAEIALRELHRVLKERARMAVDIPNEHHPHVGLMVELERLLARKIFVHPRRTFERRLKEHFSVFRADDSRVMIRYFVER
jgi:SAM-dependent methyltransferase